MLYLYLTVTILISYLIGSIPTGYLIVKWKANTDIRTIGSGSTGATNVKRVLGVKWFFAVMILDVIKGAVPVLLAQYFLNDNFGMFPVVAALSVVIGHAMPVFLKFKGGKSVAAGIGTIIALNWQIGLILGAVWAILTFITKYVSVGSIIAVVLAPSIMYLYGESYFNIAYSATLALYVVLLHRENIQRLIKGQENKVR